MSGNTILIDKAREVLLSPSVCVIVFYIYISIESHIFSKACVLSFLCSCHNDDGM